MHVAINVKSPNNISEWQMGFNSAFKGLMCTVLLPPGVNPIAVKYIISYIISYRISYHIMSQSDGSVEVGFCITYYSSTGTTYGKGTFVGDSKNQA